MTTTSASNVGRKNVDAATRCYATTSGTDEKIETRVGIEPTTRGFITPPLCH